MSDIQVNVGTDALRRILDEQPEVKLRLASMAAEKIAEEIARKAKNVSMDSVKAEVQKTIDAALRTISGAYIQKQLLAMIDREKLQADCLTYVKQSLDGMLAVLADKLRTEMKTLARNEFMSVLQQVGMVK